MAEPADQLYILVGGPSPELRRYWRRQFEQSGAAAAEAGQHAGPARPDAVLLTGIPGDPDDTEAWVSRTREQHPGIPVVVIPQAGSEDAVIGCLRAGAADYLKPSAGCAEVLRSLRKWHRTGGRAPLEESGDQRLIGESDAISRVRSFIAQVAPTQANVLITGETGTGKELIADLIHRNSPRRDSEFVRINCAALPDHLLESELFGWNRGAFTGAHANNPGKVEMASGGTILLDEIGDMSASAQAKILRLIESREAQRLGGCTVRVDVRFLAATNQDVEQLAAEGKFRKDLYFRLKVIRVCLPRLKDRKEDIPLLLDYYVGQMNRAYGRAVEGFSDDALRAFVAYDWPGNVRELRNLVEAVYLTAAGTVLSLGDVSTYLSEAALSETSGETAERDRLIAALSSARWNKSRAARQLRWSRMTLYRKMRQYHISELSAGQALQAV